MKHLNKNQLSILTSFNLTFVLKINELQMIRGEFPSKYYKKFKQFL